MNPFKKAPTVKEQMRANDKELKRAGRDIDRDRRELEREEKRLELEIKKLAKTPGNKEALTTLAKQLIQIRKQKTRTYAANSRISSVAAQQKSMHANVKLAGAMSTASTTMANMNKLMKPEDVAKTMRDFQIASDKLDMNEDIINDTMDDIMNDSEDEEEGDKIVNQVLSEIGIEISSKVAGVPSSFEPLGENSRATSMTDKELEDSLARLRAT